MLKAPRLERAESDVEDAFPWLSASDCTADGAADTPRDQRPVRDGVLWASGPVEADSDINDCCADSPEAVFEDMASLERLRACCKS